MFPLYIFWMGKRSGWFWTVQINRNKHSAPFKVADTYLLFCWVGLFFFGLGMGGKEVWRTSQSSKLMSQLVTHFSASRNTGCRSYPRLTLLMKLHMVLLPFIFPQPGKLWHCSGFPGPWKTGEIPTIPVFTKLPWCYLRKTYCNGKAYRQIWLNITGAVEPFIMHLVPVTIIYTAVELKDFSNTTYTYSNKCLCLNNRLIKLFYLRQKGLKMVCHFKAPMIWQQFVQLSQTSQGKLLVHSGNNPAHSEYPACTVTQQVLFAAPFYTQSWRIQIITASSYRALAPRVAAHTFSSGDPQFNLLHVSQEGSCHIITATTLHVKK